MKFAVRLAILLPLDVRVLMSSTGFTRALRMAMIISDGWEDVGAVAGVTALAASDDTTRALNAQNGLISFKEREARYVVGEVAFCCCALPSCCKEVEIVPTPSVFGLDTPPALSGGLDDSVPKAKNGKKDPGREA